MVHECSKVQQYAYETRISDELLCFKRIIYRMGQTIMESNLKAGLKMKNILQLSVLSAAIALVGCGGGGSGSGFYNDGTTPAAAQTPPNTAVTSATVPAVTIGSNNTATSSADNVYYLQSMSVTVTDQTGKPLANQQVDLSVIPTEYFKGFYTFIPATTGTPATAATWAQSYYTSTISGPVAAGAFLCLSEDKNGNGILDPGEDLNGNGKLDPINPVTFVGPSASSSTTTTTTTTSTSTPVASYTTDSSGKLDFSIRYAKVYADWLEVNLKASATVNGVTSANNLIVDLRALVTDFDTSGKAAPPNEISPFGQIGSCTNPN